MRRLMVLSLAAAAGPALLMAGPIYGSIFMRGAPLPRATVTVSCAGRVDGSGATRDDGSYRVIVQQEGRCVLTVSGGFGAASAQVVSSPGAAQYNFEVVPGSAELRRR